jgi:hypothetical protein
MAGTIPRTKRWLSSDDGPDRPPHDLQRVATAPACLMRTSPTDRQLPSSFSCEGEPDPNRESRSITGQPSEARLNGTVALRCPGGLRLSL